QCGKRRRSSIATWKSECGGNRSSPRSRAAHLCAAPLVGGAHVLRRSGIPALRFGQSLSGRQEFVDLADRLDARLSGSRWILARFQALERQVSPGSASTVFLTGSAGVISLVLCFR